MVISSDGLKGSKDTRKCRELLLPMWPHEQRSTGKVSHLRAFTLLELLVVMAVIGILAALLLPSLSAAKAKASGAVCLNNLKQLQVCWQLYVAAILRESIRTIPLLYLRETGASHLNLLKFLCEYASGLFTTLA